MRHMFKNFLIDNEPHIATAIDYYLLEHLQGNNNQGTLADQYIEKLNEDGFLVIENFLEESICDELCKEMDMIFDEHESLVQIKGDSRLFGIECLSEQINKFKEDLLLEQIANQYYQRDSVCVFSLGGKLAFSEGEEKSSGGGWHRDSFFRQFKAMIYLTDVEAENGAFQIMKHSEKPQQIVKDMQIANLKYSQNRIDNEQIQKLIYENPERLITFAKPKGTLILFDSTTIHRGAPIQKGERYSITNYYFPTNKINRNLLKHFSPNVYYDNDNYTEYWNKYLYKDVPLMELFKQGRYHEVVQERWCLGDTIEQNFYKGKSYKHLGDTQSAIECFKLYLEKINDLSIIQKYKEIITTSHISSIHFHLGECYLILEDYNNAKPHLVECLKYSNFTNGRCKELLKKIE